MALGFGRAKNEDVVSLIAAKKYGRAIELLRAELKKRGASTTLRKQLADVLLLSGKASEAVALLLPLADQFASEGFAAKAVSVLKKVQKVDPGRRDVEERLARLIEEKQREAIVLPTSAPGPEIGMEEIGIEPPPSGPLGIPAMPPAALETPLPEPMPARTEEGPALEIGAGAAPVSAPGERAPAPMETRPETGPEPADAPSSPAIVIPAPSDELAPIPLGPPEEPPTPPLEIASAPAAEPESIEDYDLVFDDVAEEGEETDVEVSVVEEAAEEPMSDGRFADELMSLVDSVFQESPAAEVGASAAGAGGPAVEGSQIVVSPLFRDFSVDEMVAVIQGLKLLSFERGDVIIREGQAGGSLYTLTSGRVRAFRKNQETGNQERIGDLKEGAFFGEMSILTGQPRNASVVALTGCELLELDRPTLDDITKTHPHVWNVLREFAERRAQSRA